MKQRLLQRAGIMIGILALLCLAGLGIGYFSGNQITVARCIVTTNGSLFMVYEDRPVQLNKKTDISQTGDLLLILHDSNFAESYPELKSGEVFRQLQAGIADAEEHLQAARRVYNANVAAYNTSIVMFPASLLAGGRTAKEFFEAESHKREDVKMSF